MKNTRKVKDVEFLSIRLTPQKYAELKVVAASVGSNAASFGRQAIYKELACLSQKQHQQAA